MVVARKKMIKVPHLKALTSRRG